MGVSKIVLLGGVSVILGIYALGIKKADTKVENVVTAYAELVQTEEIAKSGVQLAINILGTAKPAILPQVTGQQLLGGTMSFTTDTLGLPATDIRITATGQYYGHQVTRIAVVRLVSSVISTGKKKKIWNRWATQSVFTKLDPGEFAYDY